ncbi:PepSY domain-containing protein [Flavobacterium sp.]|uniref:PepSY domain-containing protein n=1 Tax=Flavobacterium sp. TaxID=239 RepID=UPI00120FB834|nr:PepSY domain-containing protein [Flavobacterium sp.]RZJ73296.1 MAG: FAD-binding oxidoreductase [Flavobacterium sp.]
MTISIWRYSHLALAVSSFLFLLLASITGIALAFLPVSESLQPYAVNTQNVTLAETLGNMKGNFDEVIALKVRKERFVEADVINANGDSENVYINPKTGKSLGKVSEKQPFFQFMLTLHRSLFLHGLGRLFMGITAFLLFLISLTGIILVVKRQRGLRHFFSKVVREDFFSFYHVVFGRIWLIPILIISATGVVMTLEEFEVLQKAKFTHDVDYEKSKSGPKVSVAEFAAFRNTPLSEVKTVDFPFSDDIEDAFTVRLTDREWIVNQFTGEILSEKIAPPTETLLNMSQTLHTGRTNLVWAMILAIACVNIIFFIYSGFAMTLKRRSSRIRNKYKKSEAEIVVLVGSENGSTMGFAKAFHLALIKSGQKSHFTELNRYDKFESAKHIVVITATYGSGEAPTNAKKALALIEKHLQNQAVNFSVVGFGSHNYPDFCQFAYHVYNAMSLHENLNPFLEIRTVNDKSIESFTEFVSEWSNKAAIDVKLDLKSVSQKPRKLQQFKVVTKTESEIDGAFLVTLESVKNKKFRSGDLLNVYPADDHRERQYSIGKVQNRIQLSVKRHEFGLGSKFLYELEIGQTINARIVENPEFHFNPKSKQSILISNGTGIAPFLGMIDENSPMSECHLYCGFRNSASFAPYETFLDAKVKSGKLTQLHRAFSREGESQYVKNLLERDSEFVSEVLKNGGQILLCGSLAMQNNVLELLSDICESKLRQPLSHFQSNGQIKMDCY